MNMQLQPPNGNPSPFMLAPQESEETGFDFWGVLRRRKWLVFLGLLAGLAVGGIYNSQAEKVYESSSTITIQPREKTTFQFDNAGNPYNDQGNFDVRHDQLIAEDNILGKCLNQYGLKDLVTIRDFSETDRIKEIQENLEIAQNREEHSKYELTFTSLNASDARTVLATIVKTYEKHLDEKYNVFSSDTMELLTKMEDKFDKEVKAISMRLIEARDRAEESKIAANSDHIQRIIAKGLANIDLRKAELQELSQDLSRSETALENGREACLEHLWILEDNDKVRTGLLEVTSNAEAIANQTAAIDELVLQRETLELRNFGPGHASVQAINLQIKEREAKVELMKSQQAEIVGISPEEIIQRFIVSVKQQIGDLRSALSADFQIYKENHSKAVKTERAVVEVAELMSEREKAVTQRDGARNQLIQEKSTLQTRLHKGFIFETTRPAYRGREVWPLLAVILPIAGLFGSLLGFGLGCLVELADKTFHNPDQITRWLQVPLIGHIPVITQGKRYLVENSLIEPIVCTYHRPKSQVSEAFRAVRTALYFNTQGKQNSVIQVTSPTPGDGKSTLASNLAVSIAQSGKRVLLVDADMRRPRQHATFGITSRVGFATVLSGQSEWRNCMFECEEIEGLTVMPCGAKPKNPAELSSSPQVKVLIEEMREEFDFVIIDTPPMLAVTDPSPIAARVDGVVLCIRIKKNVRISAERSTQLIQNLGANCIGLVVNGVGAQSGYGSQYTYGAYRAGYSYNGYGYGYGYGAGGSKYYDEDQKGRQARRDEPVEQAPALIESDSKS